MPTRILTVDIPVVDLMLRLPDVEASSSSDIRALMTAYAMTPGRKQMLASREDYEQFDAVFTRHGPRASPGGSVANMLATLKALMGEAIEVDLLQKPFRSAHITAFTVVDEQGRKSSAIYVGQDVRDSLPPEMVTHERVEACDVVLLQGTNWSRLDPRLSDRLRSLSLGRKEQWLTLPTNAALSDAEADRFRRLIPDTHVVLGNMGELHRVYRYPGEASLDENAMQEADRQRALARLQASFSMTRHEGRPQVGFITGSVLGSYVVTADHILHVPPAQLVLSVVSDLGAGDTANAGFMFGYLHGLPYDACARIGNVLAVAKLAHNAPRLSDPGAVIRERFPDLVQIVSDR